MASTTKLVVWFRNDLRVLDNAVLTEAARRVATPGGPAGILPVFILDPRRTASVTTRYGSPKTGPFRVRFLRQSLLSLRQSLSGLGAGLLIAAGTPAAVAARLAAAAQPARLVMLAHAEPTPEETADEAAVASALAAADGCLELLPGSQALIATEDLPPPWNAGDLATLPGVFTRFRQLLEAAGRSPRPPLAAPASGALPPWEPSDSSPGITGSSPGIPDSSPGWVGAGMAWAPVAADWGVSDVAESVAESAASDARAAGAS